MLLGLCAAGLAARTRNFVLHPRFTGWTTHGVAIDLLGEFGELFVGFFFLVQGLLKKILRFALAQQAGPRSYAAISGNFVVFDSLRRRNESGIFDPGLEILTHHLVAFLNEAGHCRATLSIGLFAHGFENFLQTFDVPFRLFEVFFESGTELL